ncbi:MAG: meiotic nuclear divisions 1 [Piptocephalis tieghemiana]|nr:MAG: meiotic nuclear divisions 1 [Piptocephalis tieghemiana]
MAKGVSAAEKKTRLLALFHESKDVYQLKDLEKIAPKAKGIVQQSVKDVLQQLVDEGAVTCEKIGTSNYYWSFPSASIQALRTKVAEQEEENASASDQLEALQKEIAALKELQEDTCLRDLEEAKEMHRNLQAQLAKYSECDPAALDRMVHDTESARKEANLWTENIWVIQSYCRNKFMLEPRDFARNFQLGDDFDVIDG